MSSENEQIIRRAYQTPEDEEVPGWIADFTEDGTFTDDIAAERAIAILKTFAIALLKISDLHGQAGCSLSS